MRTESLCGLSLLLEARVQIFFSRTPAMESAQLSYRQLDLCTGPGQLLCVNAKMRRSLANQGFLYIQVISKYYGYHQIISKYYGYHPIISKYYGYHQIISKYRGYHVPNCVFIELLTDGLTYWTSPFSIARQSMIIFRKYICRDVLYGWCRACRMDHPKEYKKVVG